MIRWSIPITIGYPTENSLIVLLLTFIICNTESLWHKLKLFVITDVTDLDTSLDSHVSVG